MAQSEVKNAMKVLEEAKCLEQQGQTFYRQAAARTKNEKGKELFLSLAQDEVMHENLIQREMLNLIQQGYWVELMETQTPMCDWSQAIFPQGRQGLEKAVRADADDIDALMTALEMETKSYDMYRREADAAQDPHARQLYGYLATQERNHFDLLMANYESMVKYGGWAD